MTKNRKSEHGNARLLREVWTITRGCRGLVHGPEFRICIVAWVLTGAYWIREPWWDQVIATVPTLLGFTLTGFAIFLGFGSDNFKRFLAMGSSETENQYLSVGAAFVLFVIVQLAALIFAMVVKGFQFPTPDFLVPYERYLMIGSAIVAGTGYFAFLYGLILSLRAALRIYRLSRWYSMYLRHASDSEQPQRKREDVPEKERAGKASRTSILRTRRNRRRSV
ncbi:Uncharacterised protein [Bordetella hinzii]|nr:Uncharacterised protein [Bordetella hinzii]